MNTPLRLGAVAYNATLQQGAQFEIALKANAQDALKAEFATGTYKFTMHSSSFASFGIAPA